MGVLKLVNVLDIVNVRRRYEFSTCGILIGETLDILLLPLRYFNNIMNGTWNIIALNTILLDLL